MNKFVEIVSKIEDKKQLKNFLEGILTPKELDEIEMRLKIVKMLKKGVAQREIAGKLGVGIATVTRGSKELQNGKFDGVGI